MGLKVSAVRDCSIELVNERGHWLVFAVDELSMDIPDRRPERVGGPEPLAGRGFSARTRRLRHRSRACLGTPSREPNLNSSAEVCAKRANIEACNSRQHGLHRLTGAVQTEGFFLSLETTRPHVGWRVSTWKLVEAGSSPRENER